MFTVPDDCVFLSFYFVYFIFLLHFLKLPCLQMFPYVIRILS
jgi:hypothetical protein